MYNQLFSKSGLSLDRFHSFLKVSEYESFTKAAEGDSNKQTLYSRQVKELEKYFETELFSRRGRTVVLTESGKRLQLLIQEYFSALEDFQESCSSSIGEIKIGAGESLIQWLLMPRLMALRRHISRAELTFRNMRTNQIVDAVMSGEVDFGIIRDDAVIPELKSTDLGKMEYRVFCPVEDADEMKCDLDFFVHLNFAVLEGHGTYVQKIENLVREYGVLFKRIVNCSSYPAMARIVKSNRLAAILPVIASEDFDMQAFRSCSLELLNPFSRDLVFVWNSRLSRVNTEIERIGNIFAKELIINFE